MPWEQMMERGSLDANKFRQHKYSEDEIARSMNSVDRAIKNFDALKENYEYYKMLVKELTAAFDTERGHVEELTNKLAAAETRAKENHERAVQAEQNLVRASSTMSEMENELATLEKRFDKLLHSVNRLAEADQKACDWDMDIHRLLAA